MGAPFAHGMGALAAAVKALKVAHTLSSRRLTGAPALEECVSPFFGWKTKPSYAIVATEDRAINPDLERFMYQRSHSITTEIAGSHVIYMSHAREVTAIIETAARTH